VAVVAGLSLKVMTKRHLFRLSFHFGLFQAAMLAAGWLIGSALYSLVSAAAHWVAFALLLLVGGNVMWHAFYGAGETRTALDPTSGWQLVFLSFATSLDALAVGLSLAMLGVSIALSASVVGLMATALTLLGMALGRRVSVQAVAQTISMSPDAFDWDNASHSSLAPPRLQRYVHHLPALRI